MYQINGTLPTLNEHDKANRTNRFAGAKLKREATDMVAWQLKGKHLIDEPCKIKFVWMYSGKHDYDNIAFAKKYVLDGMVKAGVLKDDNQNYVLGFRDEFLKVNKGNEGVIIHVEELHNLW